MSGCVGDRRGSVSYVAAGARIKERRKALGLTQVKACQESSVSRSTWHRAESGTGPISDANAGAMMRVLHWSSDTYSRLLEGGEPVEVQRPSMSDSSLGAVLEAAVERVMDERTAALEARVEVLEEFARVVLADGTKVHAETHGRTPGEMASDLAGMIAVWRDRNS